jgi:orotidine-5'-phosphate decarboxylase
MTKPIEAALPVSDIKKRIIVALDVESADDAEVIVRELKSHVGAFKVGLQLFAAAGPVFVRKLVDAGEKVFLDLKFHDIPNTVAKAGVEAARLGVWMFNLHASGGREMMERTVAEVSEVPDRPLIIAVTVLTSSNAETLAETGVSNGVEEQVISLAKLASECRLDGVVASPHEVRLISEAVRDPDFLTITPGIRPSLGTHDDQKRVTTIGQALANGSSYVVIGRPITRAADRIGAVERIVSEVDR